MNQYPRARIQLGPANRTRLLGWRNAFVLSPQGHSSSSAPPFRVPFLAHNCNERGHWVLDHAPRWIHVRGREGGRAERRVLLPTVTRVLGLGNQADLDEGILRLGDAFDMTPDGHPGKPVLNNLSVSFLTRFERLGQLNDLEDVISMQREAADHTPDGHPDKPSCLNSLGNSFLTRFKRLGQANDLEDAISRERGAVDLTPGGHSDKLSRLNSLGISLGGSHLKRVDICGTVLHLVDGEWLEVSSRTARHAKYDLYILKIPVS